MCKKVCIFTPGASCAEMDITALPVGWSSTSKAKEHGRGMSCWDGSESMELCWRPQASPRQRRLLAWSWVCLFLTGVEQCFVIIYHTLHHFQIYFRQAHGRGIDDLLGSLEPLMISLRENRLRHGMSVAEAMPIAHCTVSWTEVSVPSTRHVTTAIGQSAIDLSGVPPRVSLVAVNTWRLVGSICELRTATANTKIAMKHSTTGCSQMWESRCMGKANGAMQYLPRGEIKRSLGHGLQEILVTSASHFAGACQCLPTTGKI